MPYLTAGYPTLDASLEMMGGLDAAGALALEVGIPFSDPIADGPDIQHASEWALSRGVGARQALELVAGFRSRSELPLVLMTYFNPLLRFGVEDFTARATAAGADGVLISDLPPEEAPEVWAACDRAGLDTVMLVAPTTDAARLPQLLRRARGFAYCLARTGVTGGAAGYSGSLPDRVAEMRRHTPLPVAVGFGIAGAADARALRGLADAVVVGAAFMRAVARDPERGAPARVRALADELIGALR